jgi:hypothetical protein
MVSARARVTVGGQSHVLKPGDGGEWETTLVASRTTTYTATYAGDERYRGSKSDGLKIKV